MKQKGESKGRMAVKASTRLWKILQKPYSIGVVGGTVRNKHNGIIRPSDKALISGSGLLNIHRHPDLPEVQMIEYDIPYKVSEGLLENYIGDIVYVSGLVVANPVARLIMHQIEIDEVNTVNLRSLSERPRLPVVSDIEPGSPSSFYSIPVEEFRTVKKRPRWCLKSVFGRYPYFARTKDGFYKKMDNKTVKEYLPHYWLPVANGIEWMVDYAILVLTDNPFSSDKKIILAGGSHWLGTFAANALISLTSSVPEKNVKFRNVKNSMSWLETVIERENIENFQVIARVTDSFFQRGKHEINVYILGVFSLP